MPWPVCCLNENYQMKKIEPAQVENCEGLTREIRDFWTSNVNAERVLGKTVSGAERGSEQYFADLEAQRYRSHRHLAPWIQSMTPGGHVLEIGCGVGLDSHSMTRHGLQVTAVDLTEVGVGTVKQRYEANKLSGAFSVANAMSLPFKDDSFDYVYSFGVLHHAADTDQTIQEAHRVLKPGGQALIMLYNRRSLNEWVHRITRIPFEEKDAMCPVVRRFTMAETRALFRKFSEINIHKDFLYGEGYGKLFELTPLWLYNPLSALIGWHLMIRATK